MRIKNFLRAALTILVVGAVGAAGCSNDSAEKAPVITTGPSASSPQSKSKPSAPALAIEGVEVHGTKDSKGNKFELSGYIRNTGKATGTFGVKCRASDNGVALISETPAILEVTSLVPGLASKFKLEIPAGTHTSVLWTYWGTVAGGTPGGENTISYEFSSSAPAPAPTANIVFEGVTATLDGSNFFHLTGTVKNTGTVAAYVSVPFEAKDAAVSLATGFLDLVGSSTLAPGASSTFDEAFDATTHTAVTWKYHADVNPDSGASFSTPEATTNYP